MSIRSNSSIYHSASAAAAAPGPVASAAPAKALNLSVNLYAPPVAPPQARVNVVANSSSSAAAAAAPAPVTTFERLSSEQLLTCATTLNECATEVLKEIQCPKFMKFFYDTKHEFEKTQSGIEKCKASLAISEPGLQRATASIARLELNLTVKQDKLEKLPKNSPEIATRQTEIACMHRDLVIFKEKEKKFTAEIAHCKSQLIALEENLKHSETIFNKNNSFKFNLKEKKNDLEKVAKVFGDFKNLAQGLNKSQVHLGSEALTSRIKILETSQKEMNASFESQKKAYQDELTQKETERTNLEQQLKEVEQKSEVHRSAMANYRVSMPSTILGLASAGIVECVMSKQKLTAELSVITSRIDALKHSCNVEIVQKRDALHKSSSEVNKKIETLQKGILALQNSLMAPQQAPKSHKRPYPNDNTAAFNLVGSPVSDPTYNFYIPPYCRQSSVKEAHEEHGIRLGTYALIEPKSALDMLIRDVRIEATSLMPTPAANPRQATIMPEDERLARNKAALQTRLGSIHSVPKPMDDVRNLKDLPLHALFRKPGLTPQEIDGQFEAMKKHGIDFEKVTNTLINSHNLFHILIMRKDPALLWHFLSNYNPDVSVRTGDGWSPLELIAHFPEYNVDSIEGCITLIVQKQIKTDKPNNARPPLHMAAHKGHLRVLKALIQEGVDQNAYDDAGFRAVHHAVIQGNIEAVKMFTQQKLFVWSECQTRDGESIWDLAQTSERDGMYHLVNEAYKSNPNKRLRRSSPVPAAAAAANGGGSSSSSAAAAGGSSSSSSSSSAAAAAKK